jgi:ketosteroid isomerase-like protein
MRFFVRVRFVVSRISLLVLVPSCGPNDRPPASPEAFDAEADVAAWVELWNTRDLARVDELFVNDSSVTYFSSEREGLIEGFAAVRAHHEGFGFVEGGTEPEQELWVEGVRSAVFGNVAVVGAIWQFGDRAAPPDSISRGPMTAVYTWTGDRYRIAHMHFAEYQPD